MLRNATAAKLLGFPLLRRSLSSLDAIAMVPDQLKDFPALERVSVQWGDMDAFQHINNAMYIKYFESARITHL
jgi:hypothetical protein